MTAPKCSDPAIIGDGIALCDRPTNHPGLHNATIRSVERIGDFLVYGEVFWGSEADLAQAQDDIRGIHAQVERSIGNA